MIIPHFRLEMDDPLIHVFPNGSTLILFDYPIKSKVISLEDNLQYTC